MSSGPQTEYSVALKALSEKLLELDRDFDRRKDDDAFNPSTELTKLLTEACAILRRACADLNSADLMPVLEDADQVIGEMVDYAYGDRELYDFVPSFAHTDASPKIDDPDSAFKGPGFLEKMVSIMHRLANSGLDFKDKETQDALFTEMNYPTSYDISLKPHERTTPLARFRKNVTTSVNEATPLAQAVYQARCSIMSERISAPIRLSISPDSSCLALAAAGSYKNRSPMLSFYLLDSCPGSEFPEEVFVNVGLSNVAYEIATDDQRKLIYVADQDRIKSYAYGLDGEGSQWISKHTLGGQNGGPIALMNNGSQILRSGKGTVDVWNVDSLPDHGSNGDKKIGRGKITREGSSRDEDEEIECSPGSKPDSKLRLADPNLRLGCWHPFTTYSPSWILCASKDGYSCFSIDLQAGGRTAARFIGHGSRINSFSSSSGDSNTFITTCNDGLVRLFDVREPLPYLSLDAGDQSDFVQSALIVHVQGIPLVMSGGLRSEQIKVWDPRARKMVYELATGNNSVNSLAWDGPRSALYAATECQYIDRFGYHHDYRRIRKTRKDSIRADVDVKDEDVELEDEDYEDDDESIDSCEEKWWPEKAYHDEEYFEYELDSGDHCLLRYAFGTDADPNIYPEYGNARPPDDMW